MGQVENIEKLKLERIIYDKNEGKTGKDELPVKPDWTLDTYNLMKYIKDDYNIKIIDGEMIYIYDNSGIYKKVNEKFIHKIASKLLEIDEYKRKYIPQKKGEFISFIQSNCYISEDEINECHMLAFNNGLLDIDNVEKGKINFTPDYFITNKLDFNYDPSATCELWRQFLYSTFTSAGVSADVIDKEMINYYQEIFGYTLLRGMPTKSIFFHIGIPDTGKSTGMSVLHHLLGIKNVSGIKIEQFNDPFRVIDLFGKAANIDYDMSDLSKKQFEYAYLKAASGGEDYLEVRGPYGHNSVSFKNLAKLHFGMNDFPFFRDTTGAVYKRIYLIEYPNVFDGGNQIVKLAGKIIKEESSGVFNWCLEGYKKLKANNFQFTVPERMQLIKEGKRKVQDTTYSFITDMLDKTNTSQKVDVRALYNEYYNDYMKEYFPTINLPIKSGTQLIKKLNAMGLKTKKLHGYDILRGYKLKPEGERPVGTIPTEVMMN